MFGKYITCKLYDLKVWRFFRKFTFTREKFHFHSLFGINNNCYIVIDVEIKPASKPPEKIPVLRLESGKILFFKIDSLCNLCACLNSYTDFVQNPPKCLKKILEKNRCESIFG